MNYSTLSSLVSNDVTFISCTFIELGENTPLRGININDIKTYTYKTMLKDLKAGDLVVVQSTGKDKPFGVHIVKVVNTDVQVDYADNHIEYKWAFQKVDTVVIESITKAEHELVQQVNKLERDSRKKAVLNGLKEQGIEIANLSIKLLS